MERIGIDQESHLHAPGGPLHESPITHCDGCGQPIGEGEYFSLDEQILDRRCAVLSSAEILADVPAGEKLDTVEVQAVAILKQFLFEVTR